MARKSARSFLKMILGSGKKNVVEKQKVGDAAKNHADAPGAGRFAAQRVRAAYYLGDRSRCF
eukprot:261272-Hanusia_phi.AAC.1